MNTTKLVCSLGVAAAAMLAHTVLGQGLRSEDRYIVQLKPEGNVAEVLAVQGIAPQHIYQHVLNGFAAQIPPGRLAALARDPRVLNIAVDHQVFANPKGGKPQPPPEPSPTEEVVPAGVIRIKANIVSQTGAGVGIAVVDTGLDFDHQDLPVAQPSFVSPSFTYTTSAQDDAGHGTHVGGIIAAIEGNELDVVGVAPGATLYAVKVLDYNGSGYDSDVISGLEWVRGNAGSVVPPIQVVNMSLGRGAAPNAADDLPMRTAIQNLVNDGISVVVSAGNDERYEVSQMVPAGFAEVIAVASTTATKGTSNNRRIKAIAEDTASFFTTDGAMDTSGVGVAISAPGEEREDVLFPRIQSVGILSTALGGGTTRMSGTSMAAPHVTGVVALLLEKEKDLDPALVKLAIMGGDREDAAPLDAAAGSYSFDGEREGIVSAPKVLGD